LKQVKTIPLPRKSPDLNDIETAAHLLSDFPNLWEYSGVTDQQRETLMKKVFDEIRVNGHELVSVKPNPEFLPLFAYILTKGVRNGRGERI
jgi:hypothetical protein